MRAPRPSLRRTLSTRTVLSFALGLSLGGCAHGARLLRADALTPEGRLEAIGRAHVWSPVDVARVDLRTGPRDEGAFAPNAWVDCTYKVQKDQSGRSPKFSCETRPGHALKVKYGPQNAEVFGEVLASRLFWALGFAADRMYPVRVRCKGCPEDPAKGEVVTAKVAVFDPAAVERKLPGRPMETKTDSGWTFAELDILAPDATDQERASRDALKLLVAFVQHTDSKAANQRLLCPEGSELAGNGCRNPVLMVSDLGLTFGQAGFLIHNKDSVSLDTWSQLPVWEGDSGCVAHLKGSFTGSFSSPTISEEGRAFLAKLMAALSDAQLRQLFESAQVKRRSAAPGGDTDDDATLATVAGWVQAFKAKRAQILDRRCP